MAWLLWGDKDSPSVTISRLTFLLMVSEDSCSLHLLLFGLFFFLLLFAGVDMTRSCEALWQHFISLSLFYTFFFLSHICLLVTVLLTQSTSCSCSFSSLTPQETTVPLLLLLFLLLFFQLYVTDDHFPQQFRVQNLALLVYLQVKSTLMKIFQTLHSLFIKALNR